jgi:hypothetical protein
MTNVSTGTAAAKSLYLTAMSAKVFPLQFPASWKDGTSDGEFLTTVDTKTVAGRKAVMAALNNDCDSLDDHINTELHICGITVHPASKIIKETGEFVRMTRVVLHLPDGRSIQAFGEGVLKSLRIRITMMGDESFNPPARCKAVRVPSGDSRSFHRLEWLD